MSAPARSGAGLAVGVTFTFALVAAVSAALNGLVALQLNSSLLRAERALSVRHAVELEARRVASPEAAAAAFRSRPDVRGVAAISTEGRVVAREGVVRTTPGFEDPEVLAALRGGVSRARWTGQGSELRAVVPVGSAEAPSGVLVVWLDPPHDSSSAERSVQRLSLLYAILNGAVVAAFGWYLVTRAVVRPIRRLSAATREVASGQLRVRVRAEGTGEIASLAADFNEMTAALAAKIGELEQANESLRAARLEVSRAEKLATVGRLAAGVAHELGNPIAAVTGYVSLLRRGPQAETEEILSRMEREMRRVDRIIHDLLEYARPRSPVEELVDVDAVVEEALLLLRGQGALDGIEVNRMTSRPGSVRGDSHRLSQVVFNLVLNACDALVDSPRKRIEISTGEIVFPEPAPGEPRRRQEDGNPSGSAVAIRVRDTGSGLTPEQKERLFEPFFTTKGKGTGLGLAISRAIVEGMGGRIRVDGEPGSGATFEVLLPKADASGSAVR